VKAIHPDKSSITLNIDKGFPMPEGEYRRRGGGLFFGPDGSMLSLHTERVWKGMKTGPEELEIFFEGGRIQSDLSEMDISKLKFAFFYAYSHGGIQINDSENVTLESLTCYTWPGFFLINSRGEGGHTYRNLRVVRRPGTSRLFGVGSDICHVGGMKRGALFDGCEFSWALDDCINVDTEGFMVYKKISQKEYLLYDRNLKPADHESYCPGDTFECYQFNTLAFAGTARLEEAEVLPKNRWPEGIENFASDFARKTKTPMRTFNGAGLWKMRFSSSPELEEGMLVFTNKYATSGTIIQNCWFHDTGGTAGRSIVCLDAEIRDCRFERVTSIPVFVTMIQSCIQGPMPANVLIENNYISDCSTSPAYQNRNSLMFGCITVNPIFLDKPTGQHPFRNIVIRGNTIINSPSASILFTSTSGGVIEGNTFIRPVSEKSEAGMFFGKEARSAIYLNACEDILIRDNRVTDPSPYFENEVFNADKILIY
jgi:hypothetical protein